MIRFNDASQARAGRWLVAIILAVLLLLGARALFAQEVDTQVEMSPRLEYQLVGDWLVRQRTGIPGLAACIYGHVDVQHHHLLFTSISAPTYNPAQDCQWGSDSLIGGIAFFVPQSFDQDSVFVMAVDILQAYKQLRFFGVVHDTLKGRPVIYQVIRRFPQKALVSSP